MSTLNPLLDTIIRFWRFAFRGRGHKVISLLAIMVLAALMEMATLVAIIPLVASLIDGSEANIVKFMRFVPKFYSEERDPQILILFLVVVVVTGSAILRVLVTRLSSEFAARVGTMLQRRYFNIMINAEYEDIVNESSSKKINIITTNIPYVVTTYILNALTLTTCLISAIGIIAVLVWISTGVIFVALFCLTIIYFLIAYFSRRRLRRYGKQIAHNNPRRIQYLQDSMGGIRDVIMGSVQPVFIKNFTAVTQKVEVARARLIFYAALPRPVLEAIGISTIAVIAYYISQGSIDGDSVLPILGAFSLGLLRLLPYIQKIFAQWAGMYHGHQMLIDVMHAMNDFKEPIVNSEIDVREIDSVLFDKEIRMENIQFRYRDTDKPVLKNANLIIKKGEFVGVVGLTGSGKSTLVDILMGLLPPTEGCLSVDGVAITELNREAWRMRVAHVPQRVYLSEGSILSNIAFAVPEDQVDMERVKRSAKSAHIDDFIRSMPLQYQTNVGENGARLSGGQRQRLGIARALYARCDVLVFDEATNAVDKKTEKAIISELKILAQDVTVISVAHNEVAVSQCDHIFQVIDGSVTRITAC